MYCVGGLRRPVWRRFHACERDSGPAPAGDAVRACRTGRLDGGECALLCLRSEPAEAKKRLSQLGAWARRLRRTIQSLDATYDKAFLTFYDKVKETPGYCSKAKIEEIRPEINRHLAGDYTPRKKVQESDEEPAIALPPTPVDRANDYSLEEALIPQDSR